MSGARPADLCGEDMGRRGELSDFQRGMVVGCHLSKKSLREISVLLDLPRSTVNNVVLRYRRDGITTVLPRCGRPQKLKEQDRQLLEKMALERCLPSIGALTAEFQVASGAKVSTKTVRRELWEMGFKGRLPGYQPREGKKAKKVQAESSPGADALDVSHLDLRVGRIITALKLQDTNSFYQQQVDVGEAVPRTVVSELAGHIPLDQMQNRLAVLVCNIKPVKVGDVMSQALVLCASSPDKMEILEPPSAAVPGDIVTVQGLTGGELDKALDPKKEAWEQIQPHLRTDAQCVATYKGAVFEVAGKGVCKAQTLSDAEIK